MGQAEEPIERYLCRRVVETGGRHRKAIFVARKGSPDRWCFWPGGLLLLIECKAPGKKPDASQKIEQKWLKEYGFNVYTVDSKEAVDDLFRKWGLNDH